MEYATGTLPEPLAVLVATHLALCPACRSRVGAFEAIGGALLDNIGVEGVSRSLRSTVLAKLNETGLQAAPMSNPRKPASIDPRVPEPLRSYLDGGLDELAWKPRGPVEEVRVLRGDARFTSRLLRAKAGVAVPRHTHDGTEWTLVLAGSFTDRGAHFQRGDVEVVGPSVDHRPLAGPDEDCYCLVVHDAPLRLTGRFSRFLNPFIRI